MIFALDIDGLLCKRYYDPNKELSIPNSIRCGNSLMVIRPHLDEFLSYLFEHHTVGIYSCITNKNLNNILNRLFKKKYRKNISFTIDRESMGDDKKTKKISMVGELFHLPQMLYDNIILIDDSIEKVFSNPKKNYIIVPEYDPEYDPEQDDNYLLTLLDHIKSNCSESR